ncbi:MAG: ornithine cyclodeaminase family protein [Armatimonadetes bacterium]|nr:ornithine cyclodeaminase family protein [Armatimonadota bacterium]
MSLYLTEEQVDRLLVPRELTDALEASFRGWARGEAAGRPRLRVQHGRHVLHNLPAISSLDGKAATKTYLSGPAGVNFVTVLFDLETCRIEAVVESNRLGQLRTGCATALACRYLAPPGPKTLAILGSGTVARGQLEALGSELELAQVRVWSRKPEHAREFSSWARSRLAMEVRPCDSAAQACADANLVVTATTAREPFLDLSMLAAEVHVNAVGANWHDRREVSSDVVLGSDLVVIDDPEQGRREAGDLLLAEELDWSRVLSLADLVLSPPSVRPRRTLFKSLGVALEDLAAAALVVRRFRV